jgi:hypothetical protein
MSARALVVVVSGCVLGVLGSQWIAEAEARSGLRACREACSPRLVVQYENRWGGSVCVCDDRVDPIGYDRDSVFDRVEDLETDL